MKNILRAAVALVALSTGCAPAHQEFTVAGNTPPSGGGNGLCSFSPVVSGQGNLARGTIYPVWQKSLQSDASAQQLHYTMALSLINGLPQTTIIDSAGHTLNSIHGNDIQVTEVDASFSTVPEGVVSIPDVTVAATGLVPVGGNGVTIFDLLSADASKAIAASGKRFTLLANVTVKGVSGTSTAMETNPFQYPIDIDQTALPTEPSGADCGSTLDASGNPTYQLTFPNAPCGFPQDQASAACTAVSSTGTTGTGTP